MTVDRRAWLQSASRGMSAAQREALTQMVDDYFAQPGVSDRSDSDAEEADREDLATLGAIAKTIRQEGSLEQAADRARSAQVELTGWVRAAALFGETVPMIARQTGMMKPTVRRRLRALREGSESS